jgi:hypothetical protein
MNEIKFNIKSKYTLIRIGGMAVTLKDEVIITGFVNGQYTFKRPGKRKEYIVPSSHHLEEYMVFSGHDLPVKIDSESGRFVGNARFNFLSDKPEELRAFLQTNCLNPSPRNFEKALYWPVDGTGEEGIPLFKSEERDAA